MLKRKRIHEKGKISFTRYFQQFKSGEPVALVMDLSFVTSFPKRMQGRSGQIVEKRGQAYVVAVKDGGMAKQFIVKPIHLKKLQNE